MGRDITRSHGKAHQMLPLPGEPLPSGVAIMSIKDWRRLNELDQRLLDSGYMSDCAVVCKDVKWATHRAILCNRNTWFRAAFDGGFKEASTGVVIVEDTTPEVLQIVLDSIYTGEFKFVASGPVKIIEVWKAGDFFGISDIRSAAERAMGRRLMMSEALFSYDPKAKDKAQAKEPTREMIENEIEEICEALVLASNVTPESSYIQKTLHRHVCESRDVRSALSSSAFFARFMQTCPRGLMEPLTLRWIREHSLIDYRNSD
ncbi:hypothetical protein J7T55_009850 [Diaporthe amygdali]|uniref:uncharacterized protein n=1 Tax=Phomopsis amygdali TaxID=1214568 RepID=UPI0022FDF434|nr:uncharacterized protein J7T55_009850 [Diaporthe amygdali]KAJ0116700.1 hypothetical protein J7T55_009850 [Diaporthe amygdali]